MPQLPPLDTHAHISVDIAASDLLALRSVVLVATRSISEHAAANHRADPLAIWGVGVHPGLPAAVAQFDPIALREQLQRTPLLSEVGLDRRSRVPAVDQTRVFAAAMDAHDATSCVASIHSAGRASEVLRVLRDHRCSTVILHWWRGNASETLTAVELGCYFSFNPKNSEPGSILHLVPPDRILTETDHPYGDAGTYHARPGDTAQVEMRLTTTFGVDPRELVWRNFRRLVTHAGILDRLPTKIAGLALSVPA